MNAFVNGHKVHCLIDTGSTVTLIKQSVLKRIATNYQLANKGGVLVRSFGGKLIPNHEEIFVTLQIEQAKASIKLIVMRDAIMTHDFGDRVFLRQLNKLEPKKYMECLAVSVSRNDSFYVIFGDVDDNTKLLCREMLKRYRECISFSMSDLGKANAAELVIKCITDEPVVYHPYQKCVFFSRSIDYLGRETSCEGVKPGRMKIEAVVRMMEPQKVKKEYTIDIKYRSDPRMSHVDALSRYQQELVKVNQINLTEGNWVLVAQLQDEQLRRIRTILQAKKKNTWGIHVKDVPSTFNTAYNKSINCTPTKILMGYKVKPLMEAKLLTEVQNDLDRLDLKQLRVKVKERIKADQAKQNEYYDRSRREANEYKKGGSGVSTHH
ncbi:hypothetical protein ILUMI_26902 [Ignelater luminosus]|uniref:Peptidase A2 domain-containing protein n=1 Tax=Ignelater luminosus TaxID=2038154 RepID=A0A8K0C5S4_IGNLU|nr:hypothetical protein ILUMI_26902 [Ignelater luminosus]